MPRTVDEILQHGDQLAARFEDYEPDPAVELDPAPSNKVWTHYRTQLHCETGSSAHARGALTAS